MRSGVVVSAVVAFVFSGCGILTPDLSEIGTVEFLDLEGGCWVLETERATYSPINLPDSLRIDGLDVRFEADFVDDVAGFCPGRIIQLERISRIE